MTEAVHMSFVTFTFYTQYILKALTLLMGLHVPQIASKVARALPRYTDIIVADVGQLKFI